MFQTKLKGAEPPVVVTVAVPLFEVQIASVVEPVATRLPGSFCTVVVAVFTQPLASVTVTA